MNIIILGNIIALIASLMQFVVGIIKNREKALYMQTVQYTTFAISTFILGGFSGTIANIISIVRNILTYNEKLTKVAIVIIILISAVLTFVFNNLGLLGLLPLINTIIYTAFINVKDPLKFKILFTITIILWLVYDIAIKSYSSAIFDICTITGSLIAAYQIYKNNKTNKEQQI